MLISLAFCSFVISKSSPEPVKSALSLVTFSPAFKISKRSFLVGFWGFFFPLFLLHFPTGL